MQNALAIIQPSLFEGWSTVVEDAKALNQHVIASSLSVHKEQLEKNASFFDPFDYKRLAELMTIYSDLAKAPPREKLDYMDQILRYKENLETTFEL
jgi:hypothetical protein